MSFGSSLRRAFRAVVAPITQPQRLVSSVRRVGVKETIFAAAHPFTREGARLGGYQGPVGRLPSAARTKRIDRMTAPYAAAAVATYFSGGSLSGLFGKIGTSAALQQASRQRGPQAPRGYSPSAYGQRLGRTRYNARRYSYMSPPDAGSPPSALGFALRGGGYEPNMFAPPRAGQPPTQQGAFLRRRPLRRRLPIGQYRV